MEPMFPKVHEQECLELHFDEPTVGKLSRWKANTHLLDKIAVNMNTGSIDTCLGAWVQPAR